jgi:uncharacterized UBP type Zn finger protein
MTLGTKWSARLGDTLRRLVWSGRLKEAECTHLDQIQDVTPSAEGCEDCLKIGDKWVHLRMCLICGHVGCCDNSKNKHATKHFHAVNHPLIISMEPSEDWMWCFPDETLISTRKYFS